MAREFGRNDRVASQMQKELAYVLQREIADSRLGFITINEVELTRDLAYAKIYVTVLNVDDAERDKQLVLLNKLAPQIRHFVAKRMKLRHISEFRFLYDNSLDNGMRIDALLKDLPKSTYSDESVGPDGVSD